MSDKRPSWGSKLGVMLAAAGSAVGLGNMWRFPFSTAQNGGGSFLLIYLICAFSIGLSLVFAEAALGMKVRSDPTDAFGWISPKLRFIGVLCVLTSIVILPYYSVVGGWILAYVFKVFTFSSGEDFNAVFNDFSTATTEPLIYFLLYLGATATIVYFGIQNGIEKFSKVMMPLLLVLLVVLMVRVLMLDKAWDGVVFFFRPDFSKLTGETMLNAMGQVFFSISVGMGIYITYGSYVKKDSVTVCQLMWPVIVLDILVSLLAGLTIFPAVFSFDVPINAGPSLIFITLPQIFVSIPFGRFFGFMFFVILLGAAATSSISLLEVAVTFMCDQLKITRRAAVVRFSVLCLTIGTLVSMSFGRLSGFTVAGKNLFDQFDFLASNILLPTGGFLTCIAIGWVLGCDRLVVFQNKFLQRCFAVCVKWIAPAAIVLILLKGLNVL